MAQLSPVAAAKALKNPAELDGMREAHLRDSVALAETLLWLEQQVWPAITTVACGRPCKTGTVL